MLIDTHCHLDFPEFALEVEQVVDRAKAAGVAQLITISTSVPQWPAYRALAETYENVFFSIGTHPHRAHEDPEAGLEELIHLAQHPKCVAIGEAGLDYHYDSSPRDVAERVFRTHIAAARRTGLPLVIHSRDADADMAAILTDEAGRGPFAAVLHCFTGSRELARTGLELGFFISFSGVLTFKNSPALRVIAEEVPLDRALVETDAPFLAPVPNRGRRNEPAFVVETAKKLAEVKGLSLAAVAEATTGNAQRLFAKLPAFTAAGA